MAEKAYYDILQVAPTASAEEIKKAYRKLALQYHPDTANEESNDGAKFRELQEAYRILGDAAKRQAYHYKRFNANFKAKTTTAETLAQQAAELLKFTRILDPHRMNHQGLQDYVLQLLNEQAIQILQQEAEPKKTANFVHQLLRCSEYLPFPQVTQVHDALLRVAANNEALQQQIRQQNVRQKRQFFIQKYQFIAALCIAILLCLLFYQLTSK